MKRPVGPVDVIKLYLEDFFFFFEKKKKKKKKKKNDTVRCLR